MGLITNSFKNGFDWLSLSKFYVWFLVLLVLTLASDIIPFVGFVFAIALLYIIDFMLFPRILKNYNQKSPFGEASVESFIAWLKYIVINMILPLINWRKKEMLKWQLVSIASVIVFGILGALISSWIMILTGIAFAAGFILSFYNSLRYSQALPVRLVETNSTFISFDRSWELTEGKALSVFGLGLILGVFSLFLVGIVLILIFVVFLGGAAILGGGIDNILANPWVLFAGIGAYVMVFSLATAVLSAFLALVGAFAQVSFYIGLKKEFVPSRMKK